MSEKVQEFCAAVSEWEKEKVEYQNFQGKGWFNQNIVYAQSIKWLFFYVLVEALLVY